MSGRLRQVLFETYQRNYTEDVISPPKKHYIQIDDQDDHDNIAEFCNIFVNFKKKNHFEVELSGKFPITKEMADLIEIYQGCVDTNKNKVSLTVNPHQVEVLMDFASLIKKSAYLGDAVGNPNWQQHSARTISSLYRFVRLVREYMNNKQSQLV